MALSFASLAHIPRRPALLCAASATAFYLPWTWSLPALSIIRQTPPLGGFLRLTRLMNVAIFTATFIVPFVFTHGPCVFGFSIHSGIYLLQVHKWDGCVMDRVAVAGTALSGSVSAMWQRFQFLAAGPSDSQEKCRIILGLDIMFDGRVEHQKIAGVQG